MPFKCNLHRYSEGKFCLHGPDHWPKCIHDEDSADMTADFAPFSMTQSTEVGRCKLNSVDP